MALDFPLSPTDGDVYNNYYYDSSITAWRSSGSKTGVNQRTTALEIADATTNKSGLVPVVPSTFSTVGGTSSRSGSTVTFTGVSSVSLNNCFTSTYENYKIIFTPTGASTAGDIYLRFRSGGTDNTTTNYYYAYTSTVLNSNPAYGAVGASAASLLFVCYIAADAASGANGFSADIFNPMVSSRKKRVIWQGLNYNASVGFAATTGSGAFNSALAMDGFTITTGGQTITGTIQVLGYNS